VHADRSCRRRAIPLRPRRRQRGDPRFGDARQRDGEAQGARAEDRQPDRRAHGATIGSESIEEYATRVFESWKLGEKGKDNGVLVVVAPKDRKMRIEVGYGLEGTLTDVGASRIIRNVMTPAFKDNDFDKGVSAGVDAIIGQLEGHTRCREARRRPVVLLIVVHRNGFPMDITDPSCRRGRCASCSGASSSASSGCSRSWAS
jgi:hypothetical protein